MGIYFKAATLTDNRYGTNYPAPPERTLDMSRFDGGLNLWDLEYDMAANQSPDMLNMWWKDGLLASRPGQGYIYEPLAEDDPYGPLYACYERLWHGWWIVHKGAHLYRVNPDTGEHIVLTTWNGGEVTTTQFGNSGGFFTGLYDGKDTLFYLHPGHYLRINGLKTTDRNDDVSFSISAIGGYVPTTVINLLPNGSGGDMYEEENRISPIKMVQFSADGTSTDFYLPYSGLDANTVQAWVDGDFYNETDLAEVDRVNGIVKFSSAPTAGTNNVTIRFGKPNPDARDAILQSPCVSVIGSGTSRTVVVGGCAAQPNAYFWSGSGSKGPDFTYFPMNHYNYAGATADPITGFGRQQNQLIIFKEHSIGKTALETIELDGLLNINLPYKAVNDVIGCDVPGSIRLVENNLVFANTYSGVFVLGDTSTYGENNAHRISRNVDGNEERGLRYDLRESPIAPTAFDDGRRYWIAANGHVYLWDYSLGGYKSKPESLSWFYFDGIEPLCWLYIDGEDMPRYGKQSGALVRFEGHYNDFGQGFLRRYQYATQHLGTYDNLKDVLRVIFAVGSGFDTKIRIYYSTDYEYRREDLTPIWYRGWRLVPRDLTYRSLEIKPYAVTAIRKPRTFHLRHFGITLECDTADNDMRLIGTQIVYRYSRGDR